jgi:hypothetical protein
MDEETEFAMGATASCVDGPGGTVSRMIIDPATETVTHLVIQPKHQLGMGRLVPLDLVDTTAGDIRLRCTVEEFGGLEPAQETELIDEAAIGLGLGGLNAPMGVVSPVQTMLQDVVPLGEADVQHGDPVYALDGEIGRVQGLLVDPPGDPRAAPRGASVGAQEGLYPSQRGDRCRERDPAQPDQEAGRRPAAS